MRGCSPSLVARGMQAETTARPHLSAAGRLPVRQTVRGSEDGGTRACAPGWDCEMVQPPLGKAAWWFSKTLKTHTVHL